METRRTVLTSLPRHRSLLATTHKYCPPSTQFLSFFLLSLLAGKPTSQQRHTYQTYTYTPTMLTLLSSPHTFLSLGSVVTGANWSLLSSPLSTLLSLSSSPSLLSLTQSLSNAVINANWSLLRSEAAVGVAYSVGTGLLEFLTARSPSLSISSFRASAPRAQIPSPAPVSFSSHLTRLRALLAPPPPPKPLSALSGSRASLAASYLPPVPGSFPSPFPSSPSLSLARTRKVSFHPTVCCKSISDATDLRLWDRDADLYMMPLSTRRVRFREEVRMAWVNNYLTPDGCNQISWPRTRWVAEGEAGDWGRVDDEGDVEMGGM